MLANSRKTALIFRLGSIGDTVVALPCFHALARTFSGYRRVLLTNSLTSVRASSAESVLAGSGLIDEAIYYPTGDFSLKQIMSLREELKRTRPEILIYLADRPTAAPIFRDLAFFKAAGVPKIVGGPWSRALRTCRIDPCTSELEYEAQRLARTLSKVTQVTLSAADWDLRLSAAELEKVNSLMDAIGGVAAPLAIAPGAKIPAKDWGPHRWAALLTSLADDFRDAALVIVGAPDERILCDELARLWAGPVLNLCGMVTPRETAAALRRCRVLACHDSGPMHLAASQGTRCVALFGNYNRPRRWYPFGPGHRVIHEPRGMSEISVQRVAAEIRAAFERVPAPHALRNAEA